MSFLWDWLQQEQIGDAQARISAARFDAKAALERDDEYMAWKKKTQAQMQKESGNRLEIPEIGSSSLLQELKFRN